MGGEGNNAEPRPDEATAPIIVGIGASAGGVRALQTFFDALPGHTGAAFVVVMHLDPQHQSELASILGGRTSMPVMQVEKTQPLQADRVYVIPPGRRLHLGNQRDFRAAVRRAARPPGTDRPVFPFAGRPWRRASRSS